MIENINHNVLKKMCPTHIGQRKMTAIIKKSIFVVIAIAASITTFAQTITRSYFCQEMGTQGQAPRVPDRIATYVEWYDNGTIKMFDGTIWKFRNQSFDGVRHYVYTGSAMPLMPGTQYVEAMFSSDYSIMQINYGFGIMGMMVPMYSIYRYLGDGNQLAFDWMNENF